MYPVRRQISRHAAPLRRAETAVERVVWNAVRDRRLGGFKFRRQTTIGIFVADLVCPETMLVVELDGGQHNEAADAKRTAFLQGSGYQILRFWNHEVTENLQGVLETILAAVIDRTAKKTFTQPSPAKAGEG